MMKTLFPILFVFISVFTFAQELKVMSYNIRYDNPGDGKDRWDIRKSELIDLMKSQNASIMGIQEGLYHQVQYLDSCLTNFTYSGVGRDDGITRGEYSAIFYDSTLFSAEEELTFWLSETPDTISVGWDASMERICTYAKLKHKESGLIIHVFNTHFDHLGEKARLESAMLIIDKIMELCYEDEHIILMGDFNAEPGSEPIRQLFSFFNDIDPHQIDMQYGGPVGTFTGFDPEAIAEKRIDYIFTANIELLSYTHLDRLRKNGRRISDHLPVIVKIKM